MAAGRERYADHERVVTIDQSRANIERWRHLNAFISVTDEVGPGPAVAVKDLIDVAGTITTAGAVVLPPVVAQTDAPLIRRIREAGCVVVGKTNLHEFAYGTTGLNPHFGPVLNPHDTNRIAGGSSSGSAVAAATGMCDWAIGSDTGGSVRIPASLCGVVGFKPTLGTVSTVGVVPLSRTLDTIGTFATTVETAARGVEMMSGLELLSERPPAYGDLKLAVPANWIEDLGDSTARAWHRVSSRLPRIDLPDISRFVQLSFPIVRTEAAAYHRHFMEQAADRYSPDILNLLRRGFDVLAVDYVDALRRRLEIAEEMECAMTGLDALVLPTTAITAPRIDEAEASNLLELLTRLTRPFNITGQPAICIPVPTEGPPVGIQVVGRTGQDARLIGIARACEVHWRTQSA